MYPDHLYGRLQDLALGRDDEAARMPPDAYAAFRRNGTTFGKFVLLEELGRGGSSVVHRAWQTVPGREVALKVVTGLDLELRERFRREVRIASRLTHAGIVPVLESGEDGPSMWLTMPVIRGETLEKCRLGFPEAALAVASAARAVQAAHDAGVIHRDLKPRNLVRDGDAVRVMDFGLARGLKESTGISTSGQVLGTPSYMAPEQANGRPVDRRTDVFGLGATLYRVSTGRAPFEAGTVAAALALAAAGRAPRPSERVASYPPALERIVAKAMASEPDARYASTADLAADLERFARGEAVSAPAVGRRVPGRAVLAAAALAAAAVVGLFVFVGRDREPKRVVSPTLHELAKLHESRGEFAPAEAALSRILRESPGDRAALLARARCLVQLKRFSEAESDLTRALQADPRDREALTARAELRFSRHDIPGSESDARAALRIKSDSVPDLLLLSAIELTRENVAAAVELTTSAIGFDPSSAEARAARAEAWARGGRPTNAIADYDKAIELGGRRAAWLLARGRCKLATMLRDGAVADFEAAQAADPQLAAECARLIEEARKRPK